MFVVFREPQNPPYLTPATYSFI
jgi:hypothetical protein